jgi:hypothetical protein
VYEGLRRSGAAGGRRGALGGDLERRRRRGARRRIARGRFVLVGLARLARELGDLCRKARGVSFEDQQADLVEHRLDLGDPERLALGPQDLLGLGRPRALVAVEQLLVELLAGAAADDLDVDVPRRPASPSG